MIEVRRSQIHGNGVFASVFIPAGTHVCDYLGEFIDADELARREEKRRGNGEIFTMAVDDGCFIDATDFVENNPARFINHSCDENCEAVWDAAARVMRIFSLRDIAAGEELSFDYGFDLSRFFEHPCRCGSPSCRGFIVAKPLRGALLRKLAGHKRAGRSRGARI